MEPVQGIILGIIQGLTEFLPVSSSGHLVLTRYLFGLREPALFFDISVHLGTLLATTIVFRKDILQIFMALLAWARSRRNSSSESTHHNKEGLRFALLVLVGSVPTALIGLAIGRAEQYFASLYLVGIMLIVTAVLLWLTRGIGQTGRPITRFSGPKGFLVGCAQGIAVLPGMSRSGTTIAAGLFLGLTREDAARLSFLMSIPAIAGAELLSAKDLLSGTVQLDAATILGTLTAFGVGYAALKTLMRIVRHGRFYLFAPYCLVVGGTALGCAFFI
ncbi:MAG: undecaprenyl-diphosphate phosphatase [Thermodesulfobacteriota bacterium]|nr:undecaprenyl-diphosphate phosphatase [Thermodesulfobacteriota bacterium]